MSDNLIAVHLPTAFNLHHEKAVLDYLTDRLPDSAAWKNTFEAFNLLAQASVITDRGQYTFRSLYQLFVDRALADLYLDELLILSNIRADSPALWAQFARRIVQEFKEREWQRPDLPQSRFLLAYFLYRWNAFARGYAFEVEVFRDLLASGIQFEAHNLKERQQRFSPNDLIVSGMMGDIKTSTYFLGVAFALSHDFYVVRLAVSQKSHTLVVFLKPVAWNKINGDTIKGEIERISRYLPGPVSIQHHHYSLVILDYNLWKQRILRLQGEQPYEPPPPR